MDKNQTIPMEIRCIVPFAAWIERHPVIFNIILTIETIIMVLGIFFYDFTTNF